MPTPTEAPVFYDDNGRRWKYIRAVLIALLAVVVILGCVTVPKLVRPQHLTPMSVKATPGDAKVSDSASGLSPSEVSAIVGRTNTPVIGKGPLVRMVHIQQAGPTKYAVPLYSTTGALPLSEEEILVVGDHEFALQRYGQSTIPNQLALTFDDGPDPVYTSKILDALAKQGVQATFFAVGTNVVKNPGIVEREAQEGHVVANHTFNHVDFDFIDTTRGEQEIIQTNRVITATTGKSSSFFRLPYMGNDEQSLRNHITGILMAQHQGYVIASSDFDTDDWAFTKGGKHVFPAFDGTSRIVMLHDSGGDRSQTVTYVEALVKEAKAHGYRFVTLNQMYTQTPSLYANVTPTAADKASLILASSYLVWPRAIVGKLFFLTVGMLCVTMIVNVLLAVWNMTRSRYGKRPADFEPLVSVVISAYNEEKVLEGTVRSVLQSDYKNLEIVIVNDGSKDDTGKVAQHLAEVHDRVRAFNKKNGGKSSGLNFGIKHAAGEIIVGIDADTVFAPYTIDHLVRHFVDPRVAAVAGNVKVGNIRNIVTRWQMLDYLIGINLERNAQAALGSVLIVPGACGAWRKSAVIEAGGYRHITLAEDFDLTLSLHRLGYRIVQDNTAVSYTEAPESLRPLAKQRFRWLYGSIQAFWKHRDMLFRRKYKLTSMLIMPLAVINVLMPVIFIPIVMVINIENLLAGNIRLVVIYFFATIGLQLLTALIGVTLARERLSLLLAVPFTRLVYSPIRTFLLYKTMFFALRGVSVGWNKLQRSGAVNLSMVTAPAQQPTIQPVVVAAAAEEKAA